MNPAVIAGARVGPPALLAPALWFAVALPALLAFNLPPSSTMLNQCIAVGLWGGVAALARSAPLGRAGALAAALLLLTGAALLSSLVGRLPGTIGAGIVALLIAALVLVHAGQSSARVDSADAQDSPALGGFMVGILVAGAASGLIALLQAFAPQLTDGNLIARSGLPGRAVGNLRQPNHLCSLLLWGVIAAVALLETRRLAWKWVLALVVLMVFAVELSASRTGALGLALLALWGALDRRLSKPARWLLIATPLIYGLSYGAMALYGHWTDQAFGAEARMAGGGAGGGDSPNARPRIWANALTLIGQQPFTGVGFGEFNFAWSLSAFPGRPTAFFDHTHTLPLQLAVELGIPLTALVLGLLGWALWQAFRRSSEATGDAGTTARAAWMLVLMIGLHSLFEYPLWYAYFLLPTAFAWGLALGSGVPPVADAARATPSALNRVIGLGLVTGACIALVDYAGIASIYAPAGDAAPLNERIAAGQRSLLFGHHADYAAATGPEPLPGSALAFRRAPHHLLDTRLMTAWAQHLADAGEVDKARWLAARLREFRNPASDEFFQPCKDGDTTAFQCQPPARAHDWREFATR
jgi:O-antigen ligase